MKGCVFCNLSGSTAIADKILYETSNFYVITTVGCLTENYIMIVSKPHLVSICYANDDLKKEFVELVDIFGSLLRNECGFHPVLFEHGASENESNKSGCCVLHAHLHIVPHKLSISEEMVNILGLKKDKWVYRFFYYGF